MTQTATVLDFNSSRANRLAQSERLNEILAAELQRKHSLQARREYLGASALGNECDRSIQFEFAGAPRERQFSPETLRKIAFGHLTEAWAYHEFIDAGFHLTNRNAQGQPYGFVQLDGAFKGHPDGVFLYGPEVPGVGYPCLWEHKGTGSKTFNAIMREGLKKARPGYYTQVNLYMAYLELTEHPAIFTITNLDSGEQGHLLIPFDADEAQRASDRVARLVEMTRRQELSPRPFAEKTHFVCKAKCDFPQRCWSLPQ